MLLDKLHKVSCVYTPMASGGATSFQVARVNPLRNRCDSYAKHLGCSGCRNCIPQSEPAGYASRRQGVEARGPSLRSGRVRIPPTWLRCT